MRLADPPPPSEATVRTLELLPRLELFRTIARAPTVLDPWLGLGGTLLTALDLDPVLRELAILEVATATGCDYERRQHHEIARAIGALVAQVLAVEEGRLDDPSLGAHGAVLRFVRTVTTTHRCSEEAMVEARTRLSDRHIVELLLVVGYYVGLALLVNAVDLEAEAPDGLAVLGLPQHEATP